MSELFDSEIANTNTGTDADSTGEALQYYGKLLPKPTELSDVWDTPVQLAPEIITGVLREKHKLILTAPSKAGKTFAMMELACAVAGGLRWLDFECKQARVLYINLELDKNSCFARFQAVGKAMGLKRQNISNIVVWNLRGANIPMSDLAPKIADMVRSGNFDLVIIDPVYKLFTGSENDQEAVTAFCNSLDKIAEAGASVVYCHHHSKGRQGGKSSQDRGSGSGVFARDADAILDMIEVENSIGATGWRLEGVLREFPPFKVKHFFFRYPLHVLDSNGVLDGATEKGRPKSGGEIKREQKSKNVRRFLELFDERSAGGEPVRLRDMVEELGLSDKSIKRYAEENGITCNWGVLTRE